MDQLQFIKEQQKMEKIGQKKKQPLMQKVENKKIGLLQQLYMKMEFIKFGMLIMILL